MFSDEKKQIRKIKFNDVAEFLNAKNVPFTCPSCGADQSTILAEIDGSTASIYMMHPILIDALPSVIVDRNKLMLSVVSECGNCGSRRHFGTSAIYKWLDEKTKVEQF